MTGVQTCALPIYQKWTFDEIRLNQSKNFTNYDTTTQSSKTEDVKFWIKFKYKQGSQAHNNILFNHHIWYKKVELYYLIGDSLIYQVSGNMIPIHKKTLVDPSSLFMLPNTTDTIQCYLYLESNCGYQFISTVNNLNERILENFNLNFREAFFYGITVLSIIFRL